MMQNPSAHSTLTKKRPTLRRQHRKEGTRTVISTINQLFKQINLKNSIDVHSEWVAVSHK